MRRGVQECPGRAPAGSAHILPNLPVYPELTLFLFLNQFLREDQMSGVKTQLLSQ